MRLVEGEFDYQRSSGEHARNGAGQSRRPPGCSRISLGERASHGVKVKTRRPLELSAALIKGRRRGHEVSYGGEPLSIGFNARYMIDVLDRAWRGRGDRARLHGRGRAGGSAWNGRPGVHLCRDADAALIRVDLARSIPLFRARFVRLVSPRHNEGFSSPSGWRVGHVQATMRTANKTVFRR